MIYQSPDFGLMAAYSDALARNRQLEQQNEKLITTLDSTIAPLHYLAMSKGHTPIKAQARDAYGATLSMLAEIEIAKEEEARAEEQRPPTLFERFVRKLFFCH